MRRMRRDALEAELSRSALWAITYGDLMSYLMIFFLILFSLGLTKSKGAATDRKKYEEVLVTIRELAEDGMTCLLVTHEMGFAREVADHIYFTDRGVIVEHGPPAEFFARAKDPRTRQFLSQVL